MEAIKTYIKKLEYSMGYTIMEKDFINMNHMRLLHKFVVPLVKDLELGDEVSEEILDLANCNFRLDLSFTISNEITTLILYIVNKKIVNVKTSFYDKRTIEELVTEKEAEYYANQPIEGYYDFMG